MALQLRVKLITGDTHRIPMKDTDPEAVIKRLLNGHVPFNREWVNGSDGEVIRVSAIASAVVEPAGGGKPTVAWT